MINVLHIGDYKTGTSFWQECVWPHHPDVSYVDDPERYPEIVELRHRLVDSRDLDFDANRLRDEFSKALANTQSKKKVKVMCCEALSGSFPSGRDARQIAERLRSVFGQVKVFYVIREQFSMLKAYYSQYVKIGGTLPFREFVFDPAISAGMIEKLKYHKQIAAYQDIFGKKNVFVGLFEDFKKDNLCFVKRVFEFSGCSVDWDLVRSMKVINPSLSSIGLEVQRFLNRFLRNDMNPRWPLVPWDKVVSMMLSGEQKERLLQGARRRLVYNRSDGDKDIVLLYAINFAITVHLSRICERIQIGPKIRVPEDVVEALQSEFVESNRLLESGFGLPIRKFGWIV